MDAVKGLVSKKKKRFVDEKAGFNLDLTYIGGPGSQVSDFVCYPVCLVTSYHVILPCVITVCKLDIRTFLKYTCYE
jgi:hypothetical protein